jgi:hypothetical protein
MKDYFKLVPILLLLFIVGCSTTFPGGLSDSSSPANYGSYDVLGTAKGSSKSTIVLGIQVSKPDMKAAIDQAVNSLGGDALVNVRWYSKTTNWIILPVSTITVTVKGDVIKYREGGK